MNYPKSISNSNIWFKHFKSFMSDNNLKTTDGMKESITSKTNISEINTLDQLKNLYKEYVNNNDYVYKKCYNIDICNTYQNDKDIREWLVILKKLDDTRTNEERKSVSNKLFAKHRADKLLVVAIINVNDLSSEPTSITNKYRDITTVYEVGKITYSESFDQNVANICSNGIHYFRKIDRAYFYEEIPKSFFGVGLNWYSSGNIKTICEIKIVENTSTGSKVQIRDGTCSKFFRNGVREYMVSFIDDKKSGVWMSWYKDGSLKDTGEFKYDKKIGKWTIRSKYDSKDEGIYINDLKNGVWTRWNYSSKDENFEQYKIEEGEYLNGEKNGTWTRWYVNGTKFCEAEYKYGMLFKNIKYFDPCP